MKAVTLTHNDFDGLGSLMMLMLKFKPEAHFFTNYYDFEKAVTQVIKYKHENDADTLLIADLSFSDHKELLGRLSFVFEGNVFLVDHHMYPDGFWDSFKFKHIIDTKRCATRILYEDLDIEHTDKTSDFVHMVDTWDRWQDTLPEFKKAMYLNELFLSLKTDNASLITIANELIDNDYGIFKALPSFIEAYELGYKEHLNKLEQSGLIMRSGDITFIFSWDYLPRMLEDEYNRGCKIAIAIQYGIFKVRVNQHAGIPEESINRLREALTGMKDFCHLHAFTYKTECNTPQEIVAECKHITDEIRKM